MSKKKQGNDYNKTSAKIQEEFNNVCFQLGLEISKERNAVNAQEALKDRQHELEKAFASAVTKEQEAAASKKRGEDQKVAFEAKAKAQQALNDEEQTAAETVASESLEEVQAAAQ